jgi:hypothetical protein
MGKPGYEEVMLYYESETAAYSGHFVKARELTGVQRSPPNMTMRKRLQRAMRQKVRCGRGW